MKNDYIKQALVLSIERFKLFLTLLAVVFGTVISLLQKINTLIDQAIFFLVLILLFVLSIFAFRTHFDIEKLINKLK